MLGTNDEAWWTTKKPEETKDEMVELVDHLREKLPDAVLIISTIPPQSSMNVVPVNMDRAEMTKQYNAAIKTALAEHKDAGKKVFVADPNAILTLDDLYDGIHPSREAHARIAEVFEDVMERPAPRAPELNRRSQLRPPIQTLSSGRHPLRECVGAPPPPQEEGGAFS